MLAFFATMLLSSFTAGAGGYTTIQDEGTPRTQRSTVNFAGAGVSCVDSGGITVCTIAGGSGAVITTVEINFGTAARFVATQNVVDAAVATTSKIQAWQDGRAATGRLADENEMDSISCSGIPATGSLTLICTSARSVTHGLFKVDYTVN